MQRNTVINNFDKRYLTNLDVSNRSKKSYKTDIYSFLEWMDDNNIVFLETPPYLDEDIINRYLESLETAKSFSSNTIKRKATSLEHFRNYLKYDNFDDDVITKYLDYLSSSISKKTLRFYKSDINNFMKYLTHSKFEIEAITEDELSKYYYNLLSSYSVNTAKRRVSTARNFINWYKIDNTTIKTNNLSVYADMYLSKKTAMNFAFASFSIMTILLQGIAIKNIGAMWKATENNAELNRNYALSKEINLNKGEALAANLELDYVGLDSLVESSEIDEIEFRQDGNLNTDIDKYEITINNDIKNTRLIY